jgi:metallophosphoesterase superfamily enzyme
MAKNQNRPRLSGEMSEFVSSLKTKENRVLVIGDLHEPFCLDDYLKHCKKIKEKYNCNKVVFIGDVIDNHAPSYHESDADGLGAGDELDFAIKRLSKWVKAFPEAYVTIGNHDRIISRKAQTGGIPKRWIREYSEVLNAPGWDFVEQTIIDGVLYIHGEGGTARARMKKELMPVVQGHLHTQGYIDFLVGRAFRIFGMQVGCGIDHQKYAFAYGKNFGKPFIACGVVLDGGTKPILEPMYL